MLVPVRIYGTLGLAVFPIYYLGRRIPIQPHSWQECFGNRLGYGATPAVQLGRSSGMHISLSNFQFLGSWFLSTRKRPSRQEASRYTGYTGRLPLLSKAGQMHGSHATSPTGPLRDFPGRAPERNILHFLASAICQEPWPQRVHARPLVLLQLQHIDSATVAPRNTAMCLAAAGGILQTNACSAEERWSVPSFGFAAFGVSGFLETSTAQTSNTGEARTNNLGELNFVAQP